MKKFIFFVDVIALMTFLQLILTPSAFGYIDLGTGSYLLQMLMAGLFGSLFAIKASWRHIKSYVVRWFSGNSPEKDENT